MAKWLKLYAIYIYIHFPPNLTHVTTLPTLLNADVLNFHLTPDVFYNQIAQIWSHSEEGILSRQLSSLEVTARYAQVVRR